METIELPRIVEKDDPEAFQNFFLRPQEEKFVKFSDHVRANRIIEARNCAYDGLEAALLSRTWTKSKVLLELHYWRAALFLCVEPAEEIDAFILKFEEKLQNDGIISLEQRAPTESSDELVALPA